MAVVARSRTRAPKPKPRAPWDVPKVGGPVSAMGAGFPVFSEGTPTKGWPYTTASEFIGYRLDEYVSKKSERLFHNGTDITHVGTHAWQLRGGELRYLGRFPSTDKAVGQIELARLRSRENIVTLQLVTPRIRVRPRPVD